MNCGKIQIATQRRKGQLDLFAMTCLQDGLQKGAGDKACSFWLGQGKHGLRPVHFGHKDHKEKIDVYDGIGWFHQWVTESEEVEGGALHETFALIELEDGTMKYAATNYVQFADTGAARTICIQEKVLPPQDYSARVTHAGIVSNGNLVVEYEIQGCDEITDPNAPAEYRKKL
jgi:hypothetical protein